MLYTLNKRMRREEVEDAHYDESNDDDSQGEDDEDLHTLHLLVERTTSMLDEARTLRTDLRDAIQDIWPIEDTSLSSQSS